MFLIILHISLAFSFEYIVLSANSVFNCGKIFYLHCLHLSDICNCKSFLNEVYLPLYSAWSDIVDSTDKF